MGASRDTSRDSIVSRDVRGVESGAYGGGSRDTSLRGVDKGVEGAVGVVCAIDRVIRRVPVEVAGVPLSLT